MLCPFCDYEHENEGDLYGCPNCEGEIMTPSEQCKAAGLKNLLQVSELTNQSVQTLNNWYKNKPELFAVVVAGCLVTINGESNK